ncbi:hypothetical protein, partial [Campylobacter majalis]|uniref:hypothetical protein n=1 Tax=Campylobacter majalis TaxID=2790656 RepID=UPI003D6837A8
VKAGLIGGGVDAGIQIGEQILKYNGDLKFNDMTFDLYRSTFSVISAAVTIPSAVNSLNSMKYSWNARKALKEQLENTTSLARKQTLQNRINEHELNLIKHPTFQIINYGIRDAIKDDIINKGE